MSGEKKLYLGIAVLVVGLTALVWWSLPGDTPPPATTDAGIQDESDAGPPPEAAHAGFDRPPMASASFTILIDKSEDAARGIATPSEIGKRLDVRYCGGACNDVQRIMGEADSFEIEIVKGEDLILPPKDTMDTVAAGLTPRERETVHSRPTAVILRTQSPIGPEQLAARSAFAATGVIAEALGGFVYDESCRRIQTAADFVASHAITSKLGDPAFARRHIVIQMFREPDGTAHLRTLGMQRFGSPDLSIREANMGSGPMLAEMINAVASKIAHGHSDGTITLTLDEVARIVGKKPAELSPTHASAKPVVLDIVTPERTEGDPDNDLAELVPKAGKGRDAWDSVVTALFGTPPSANAPVDDKELVAITKNARASLPAAIKRFEAGEGELFVKGPFAIAEEARVDGGASTELLWIGASSCNAQRCTGVLSNEPSYATNLAAGKVTSVSRSEVVDWMIQQRDGGTTGGESIKVLRARTHPNP